MRWQFCVAATAAASLAGCANTGPRSVAVDRFDYSTSIAESWKEQTLLNKAKGANPQRNG